MPNYPDFLMVTNFASCTSTNDYVKENCPRLRHCLPLMVNADEQSSGRGRNNRVWHSPAGLGLYATFAFAWPQRETLKFLSLLAGVAVISVLEEICNQPFCLKWPNDVLQGRKKICGILTETLLQADETVCLIGIGINVNHGTGDFPGELSAWATSLRLITGREYSVADIRVRLAFAFFFWLERLKKNGGIEIVSQADKHSRPLLGQALAVHIGRRTVRGKFVGLDSTGGLILENSAGSREIFASGEILLE